MFLGFDIRKMVLTINSVMSFQKTKKMRKKRLTTIGNDTSNKS